MGGTRPTAILTDSQLEYLKGEKEPKNTREYDRRIRERLNYGLLDLNLLFEYLPADELRKVFGAEFEPRTGPHDGLHGTEPGAKFASSCVPGAIAFLAWALNADDRPIYPPFSDKQPAFEDFIQHVETGIQKYLHEKQGLSASVDVTIELNNVDRRDDLLEESSD